MNTTKSILAFTITALLLSSCASIEKNFSKRKYDVGHQTASNIENEELIQKDYELTEETTEPTTYSTSVEQPQIVAEKITSFSSPIKSLNAETSVANDTKTNEDNIQSDELINSFNPKSETKLKELSKNLFKKNKHVKPAHKLGDDRKILEIILAIFIPPLAVFLHEDGLTTNFWIDLILCFLFWVPGVVFALLVVLEVI